MSTAIAWMTVLFIGAFAACLVCSVTGGEWSVSGKSLPQKNKWKKKL